MGGVYPPDFIARGKSNAEEFQRRIMSKNPETVKNQAVVAAEKAYRKAWRARF
jgi:hypothetical protein